MHNKIGRMTSSYIFIIDTDSYAGNFEREMTAYMTGVIGDCGVGYEMMQKFHQEVPDMIVNKESVFIDRLLLIPDDHGCKRPCSIWKSDNSSSYNSVAIFFSDKPSDNELSFLINRSHKFVKDKPKECLFWKFTQNDRETINILGFQLLEQVVENTLLAKFDTFLAS